MTLYLDRLTCAVEDLEIYRVSNADTASERHVRFGQDGGPASLDGAGVRLEGNGS